MGKGFWILTWDCWGCGLNMINPRLLVNDIGDNWFNYNDQEERESLIDEYTRHLRYFKIIE